MPPPDATTTSTADWSYVSEGGATIVFSYTGSEHPEFTGTVLRLRKSIRHPPPRPIVKPLDVAEEWERQKEEEEVVARGKTGESSDEDEEPDDPTIEFQERITSRLIPPQHLPRLETAKVSRHWLEELAKNTEEQRPAERRLKDGIDVSKRKGVLATDLVGGEGWAVEIKPKWAFIPSPTHLSPETKPIKTKYCRFCMHTYFKSLTGDTAASAYCPLDLFSGDEERVSEAIEGLWAAWVGSRGVVNNLKVFVKGKAIDPGEPSVPSLLAPYLHVKDPKNIESLLKPFIKALLPLILKTPLLSVLQRLQRQLDSLDIEGLSSLWSTSPMTPNSPVGARSPEPTIEEWDDFTDEYLASFSNLDNDHPNPQKLRYYMLSYLMSATFKDCSVILRLGSGRKGGDTITAIDLDPKSVKRLSQWEVLDKDIVMKFKEALETSSLTTAQREPCVDGGAKYAEVLDQRNTTEQGEKFSCCSIQ